MLILFVCLFDFPFPYLGLDCYQKNFKTLNFLNLCSADFSLISSEVVFSSAGVGVINKRVVLSILDDF